ncbi:YcaO-like family protein [Xanthomonas sp. MUS 060]|uniref:YcaO-like family protein n=1 Tax=Xanthomonas sp. MUS 060 TaxID=1588031 RepID=UPI0005F2EDBB|nr:YcaO-like family protein [Xanthomonas sp. MUS 060]
MHPIKEALQQRNAKHYFQGTHRLRDPAETLRLNRRHMPRLGITRLANVTGLDRIGLPVCVAIRPNARSLATSQGKGETLEAAMVSALMESLELWHAEHLQLPVRIGTVEEMGGGQHVLSMTHAPIRSDATFDPARAIAWVQGWDLSADSACWIPYELVSMNLVRQAGSTPVFLESTNGLSSGNHLAEALCHALCEVIERDAMSLWRLYDEDQRKQRQLDLRSVNDPTLRAIIDILADKGIVVGAWDITSDVGTPTFNCVILEDPASPDWRPIPAYFGAGTHLDPVVALSRAIHEAIQSRLTAISGSRDDIFQADYVRGGNRDDHLWMINALTNPPGTLPFLVSSAVSCTYVQNDVIILLEQLRRVGIRQVVAVDLTCEDIGVPVVKVVVPELEPYHTPFYRPGVRAQRMMGART